MGFLEWTHRLHTMWRQWIISRVPHKFCWGYRLNHSSLSTRTKTPTIKPHRVWYATRVLKRMQSESPLQYTNLFHFIIAPTCLSKKKKIIIAPTFKIIHVSDIMTASRYIVFGARGLLNVGFVRWRSTASQGHPPT